MSSSGSPAPSLASAVEVDNRALKWRGDRFFNRELSNLDFNERVLAMSEREDLKLLERVKFLAIFASNMDEFFQVRVAGLKDQLAAGIGTAPDGLPVDAQLQAIRSVSAELLERRVAVLRHLLGRLAEHGVTIQDWASLSEADKSWTRDVFAERIFPVLTPLAVDPGHPFPYISNLSLNLAVIVRDPQTQSRRFARVKVPPLLPGLLGLPGGQRFVCIEQVIAANLATLFPSMTIESFHAFRVTRNADLTLEEEEADDLLLAVEMELRRRRFGRAVRLEVDETMTDEVRALLVRELDLQDDDVYEAWGPLNLASMWQLYGLGRPDLKDEHFTPVTPSRLVAHGGGVANVFSAIRRADILVQHPYDSFSDSVEEFVAQASLDPDVLAIKQTLYRTSGDSAIVRSLIRAAERGKQVAAIVELKARGDEAANIGFARALEQAGVHVVYGLVGLKTHAKLSLVVRQEGDGITRFCHIGTGNYNATTARSYEDIGILTADRDIGADLTDLFNYLTGYSRREEYRKLLVAPTSLRRRMVELIERETSLGARGRIIWKLNNLVDPDIIDALYRASSAGVPVNLLVRAICCLRPGLPGLSENISVSSIVGRWLEHSRIYWFSAGDDGGPGEFYIGSADMMERNLDRRVEAIVPVESGELRARLWEILDVDLADDARSWSLRSDGRWTAPSPEGTLNAQNRMQELALMRSGRRGQDPEGAT